MDRMQVTGRNLESGQEAGGVCGLRRQQPDACDLGLGAAEVRWPGGGGASGLAGRVLDSGCCVVTPPTTWLGSSPENKGNHTCFVTGLGGPHLGQALEGRLRTDGLVLALGARFASACSAVTRPLAFCVSSGADAAGECALFRSSCL